jgi:hypothetical protein
VCLLEFLEGLKCFQAEEIGLVARRCISAPSLNDLARGGPLRST